MRLEELSQRLKVESDGFLSLEETEELKNTMLNMFDNLFDIQNACFAYCASMVSCKDCKAKEKDGTRIHE